MTPVVDRLFRYFNSAEDTFAACFADCIELAKKYGIAPLKRRRQILKGSEFSGFDIPFLRKHRQNTTGALVLFLAQERFFCYDDFVR